MSVCSKDTKKKKKIDKKPPVKKEDVKKKNPDTKNLTEDQVESLQNRRSSTTSHAGS